MRRLSGETEEAQPHERPGLSCLAGGALGSGGALREYERPPPACQILEPPAASSSRSKELEAQEKRQMAGAFEENRNSSYRKSRLPIGLITLDFGLFWGIY